MKKTALFTTAAIVAMAGVATAGTLKTGSAGAAVKAFTVAKEAVEGGTANAPLNADLTAFLAGTFVPADPNAVPPTAASITGGVVVVPTSIPLATLSGGVMNFTASTGKWAVAQGNDVLQICDDAGIPQLAYHTGTGSSSIVFDTNGTDAGGVALPGNISNGHGYYMAWQTGGADCQATPAEGTVKLTVPPGTTSTSLTVQTGIAATQTIYDTASGNILNVGYQLSGAVNVLAGKANTVQIDFDQNFQKLVSGGQPATSDTIGVSVTAAVKDLPATFAAGDKVVTTITVSDPAGLKATDTATGADVSAAPVFGTTDCADVTAAGKIVCTSTADAALATAPMTDPVVEDFLYTINVDGTTTIPEKTFNVTTEFFFDDAAMQDRTVANGNALLNNANAGSWTFRGTTIYVPLVKEAAGQNTFVKLQSKANAAVRGLVLCTGGALKAVDLGTITAGTPKLITSTDVVTALAGACTVDAANGYAMTLSVTSDKTNVFGYANTVDAAGNSKRIPLSTTSGVDN